MRQNLNIIGRNAPCVFVSRGAFDGELIPVDGRSQIQSVRVKRDVPRIVALRPRLRREREQIFSGAKSSLALVLTEYEIVGAVGGPEVVERRENPRARPVFAERRIRNSELAAVLANRFVERELAHIVPDKAGI